MSAFNSTDDKRTKNNSTRQKYRQLSDAEKTQIDELKQIGASFISKLHEIGKTDPTGEHFGSRDLALANTHAEDAVMRAVRHVTS